MRQEQIIELLVESGLIKPNSIHTNSILPEFYTFAKLVEQATLERAARHFDDRGKDKYGNWSTGGYDPDSPGIILRALKDSHD